MKISLFFALLIIFLSAGCMSEPVAFDENEAYLMLKEQTQMLHRYPEGKDIALCRSYLREKLEPCCDIYKEQDFTLKIEGKKLNLKNIIGIINPKAERYILLCSHYDNRPISDKDKDISKRKNPCPGADDGASSTAVLLETAKVVHSRKPDVGVVFVLFDGEDYGTEDETMYLGSRYFSEHYSEILDADKLKYGILLDMIGDSNLNIYIEKISNYTAPELVQGVWSSAKKLGYEENFIPKTKYAMGDDHIQLIECGIKCIDIIDFDYKYWHTTEDTPDKCSPKSLKIVGDVIIDFVFSDFEF